MTHQIFLEGGCFAIFGCCHRTDEWLEEIHEKILKEITSLSCQNVSTKTRRLWDADIQLSYTFNSTHDISTIKEKINTIIPCYEKDLLYIKKINSETEKEEIKPPNYPHLVISHMYIPRVNLNYVFQYGDAPKRRWSLS